MGSFQVRGELSGQTYTFNIPGETPTPEQAAQAQAILRRDEEAFRQRYAERFGEELDFPDSTAFGRGIDVGRTSAYGALGTAARSAGEGLGIDFLERLGGRMEGAARMEQIAEAGRMQAPTRFEDVEGVGDFLTYLGEGAGQTAPEMAATLAATGIGGLVGNLPGAIAGGTAVGTPLFFGRNIQRQEEQIAQGELDEVNRFNAFLTAGGQAAINAVGERILLASRALGLAIPPSQNLFTRTAQFGVRGAAVEAPTEIAQQMMERAQAGLPLDSDDAIAEYIEAGILGGVIGAGVGGTLGGAFGGPDAATTGTPGSRAGTPPAGPSVPPTTGSARPATRPTVVPPTITAEEAGISQEDLAEITRETEAGTPVEQTRALLLGLRVPDRAKMYDKLAEAGVGPDDPAVRAELERYLPVYERNARLMEVDPDFPARVRKHLAATAPAAPAAPAPTPRSPSAAPMQEIPEAPVAQPRALSDEEALELAAQEAARRGAQLRAAAREDRNRVLPQPQETQTQLRAAPESDGTVEGTDGARPEDGKRGAVAEPGPVVDQPARGAATPEPAGLDAGQRDTGRPDTAEGDVEPTLTPEEQLAADVPFEDTPSRPDLQGVDPFADIDPPVASKRRMSDEEMAKKAGITLEQLYARRAAAAGRPRVADVLVDDDEIAARAALLQESTQRRIDRSEQPVAPVVGAPGQPTRPGAPRRPSGAAPITVNREGLPILQGQLIPRGGETLTRTEAALEGVEGSEAALLEQFERQFGIPARPGETTDAAAAATERTLARQAAEELRTEWEQRVGRTLPSAVRSGFFTPADKLQDPSTSRDRRLVRDIARDVKVTGKNSKAANLIFGKYPSVVEALDAIADLRSRDKNLSRVVAGQVGEENIGVLEDWSNATDFFEKGLTPRTGNDAAAWVSENLSPEANAYLNGKIARLKTDEERIRKRTGKHDPVQMARNAEYQKELNRAASAVAQVSAVQTDQAILGMTTALTDAPISRATREAAMANAESEADNRLPTALDTSMAGPSSEALREQRRQLTGVPAYMRGWNGLEIAVGKAYPAEVRTRADARALLNEMNDAELLQLMEDATVERSFLKLSRRFKPLRQQAKLDVPLSAMARRALAAGNLRGALQDIVARTTDPEIRAVARAILDNIADTKVEVYDPADADPDAAFEYGFYDPATDTISLNSEIGQDTHTLLHEAGHAVTYAYFSENPNSALAMDLKAMFSAAYDRVMPHMASLAYREDGRVPTPDEVTTTELLEFATELRTNMALRASLRSLALDDLRVPRKTGLGNALEWIGQMYRRLMRALGRRAGQADLLSRADSLIDAVMSPKRAAGDVLFSRATRPGTGVSGIMGIVRPLTDKALTPTYRQKYADDAAELLTNGTGLAGRTMLGFLPQQALGDLVKHVGIEAKDSKGNTYSPYRAMELIRARDAAFSRETGEVDTMMQRVGDFARRKAEQYRQLGIVVTGATTEGYDPALNPSTPAAQDINLTKFWLAFDRIDSDGNIVSTQRNYFDTSVERDNAIAALNSTISAQRTPARPAGDARDATQIALAQKVQDSYNAMDAEAQQLYRALRDFYEKKYDRMWQLMQGEIDALLGVNSEASANAKQTVYAKIFDKGQIRPYFPLVREGDYWLEFMMYNPATQSTEPVKMTFETKGARQRMVALLDSEPAVMRGDDNKPIVTTYTASNMSQPNFRTDAMFVRSIMKIFDEHNANAPKGKGISEEVMNDIAALITKAAPEGSLARQLHKRNNTPGYSEDVMAGLREKGYRLAQATPRLFFSREMRALQQAYRDAAKGNESQTQVAVLGELDKLIRDVLAPNDSPAERAAQVANRVAYAYTLLGNVSSVLVNTSSMANVIYPQVGGRYGFNRGARSLTRMSKLFFGSGFNRIEIDPVDLGGTGQSMVTSSPSIDNYYVLQDDGSYALRTDKRFSAAQRRALEDMVPLVRMLSENGMLHHSQFFDSAGIEDSANQRGLGSKIFAFFGLPFHVVERMNRQVAAMSVYELELARLRAEPDGRSDVELQQLAAAEAVYQSQNMNGGASLNTAPRFAQRGLGRVALMYKSYGLTVTTLLFKTARTAVINAFPDTPEGRAERDIAMRQMMGHLGATFVMAGVAGLPMYGMASMIGNLLRDEDEIDFDEATRLQLGELYYKGPLNALTGFEISSRTGLSGLLYRANPYMQDASAEEQLVTLLGGPAWSTLSSLRRAARDFSDGEYWRGLEAAMPLAVSNFLRSARFAREGGAMTRADNFIYEDMTTSEILGRAIGFNPAELMRRQERSSEAVRIGRAVQEQRNRLIERLFLVYRSGDMEGADDVLDDIDRFNETVGTRYPDAAIDTPDIDRSFDRREDTIEDMMNGVSINPQVRDVLVQQMGAIYDGLTSL